MSKIVCLSALYVWCVILQTGSVGASWQPYGALDRELSYNNLNSQEKVPVLSYNYQQRNRQKHNFSPQVSTKRGMYYSIPTKAQVTNGYQKADVVDLIASNERRSRIPTSGVYKTYGRGQAVIPYPGATVHVPKTFGSRKAHRAMVSTRVFDPPKKTDFEKENVISRSRRDCAGCPKNEMVVASKGNAAVVLPEPCSYRWQTTSGPKPGSMITEGVHYITGTMGSRKKVCQYQYEVKVLRCPPIRNENLEATCSAANAWGSKCNFSCSRNKVLEGEKTSECGDSYKWTLQPPKCVDSKNCLIPNIENGTKLNCETNELSDPNSNYLPDGAYCTVKHKGSGKTGMKCEQGAWKTVSHVKNKHKNRKHRNHKQRNRPGTNCEPNPCLNGGTCFTLGDSNNSKYICMCKPFTEGRNCEFRECEDNPCKNNAKCLMINENPNCFCTQNFTGLLCETTS